MKNKKFSLTDIVVLKDNDKLATNQLSKVIGGIQSTECDCECDCFGGNCNDKGKKPSSILAS
jgi:hypothetical protein